MKSAHIAALFTIFSVAAIAQNGANHSAARACLELNEAAKTQAASGHFAEAVASLSTTLISRDERSQEVCAGHILSNIAKVVFVLGRLTEAERLAEQSVRILEKYYPPDHRALLRPLQVLANVRLESGKTAGAREIVKRMRSIRIEHPEDSAIVHATAGVLLQIEGRRPEAEAEYNDALRALEEAGRGKSADAASVVNGLGALFLKEHRLEDARRAMDRADAISDQAKDVEPLDRVKFLALRGVLHARLGEWQQSEQVMRNALSIVDRPISVDPALLQLLLGNYSYVLRRNHHRREARSIETRRAALATATAVVVDVRELLVEKEAAKK